MKEKPFQVLLATSLAAFLTPFVGSAVNVALPQLAREFAMGALTLSWVASAFMLSAAISLLPFGRLADSLGRKPFFLAGLLLFAVSLVAAAVAPGTGWLLAARVLQGAAGSLIFATALPLLLAAFPAGRRGRILGINVAAVYLGITLGPTCGGFLMRLGGWRSIFWVSAGLALAAFLLAWGCRCLETSSRRRPVFDWPGTVVYAGSLCALMIGLTRMPEPTAAALVVLALAGLFLFGRIEERAPEPLLDMNLLRRNRPFACSNLAALLHYSATAAVAFLVSLYLQYLKGFSPAQAGMVLMSQPALMALLSPLCGRLAERVQPRLLASAGMALTGTGLAALAFVGPGTPLSRVVGVLLLIGAGFALFSSPNTQAVMGAVPSARHGIASATLGTMRLLGQMLSMAMVTLVLAIRHGPQEIAPDTFPSLLSAIRFAFSLFALLCLAGIHFSLARGEIGLSGEAGER